MRTVYICLVLAAFNFMRIVNIDTYAKQPKQTMPIKPTIKDGGR